MALEPLNTVELSAVDRDFTKAESIISLGKIECHQGIISGISRIDGTVGGN